MAHTPTTGLVFLGDLHAFAPWISDRAPAFREQRHADGPLLPPTIFPPAGLVVVVSALRLQQLQISRPWLALARRLVIAVETSDDPEWRSDPDLAELADEELRSLRGGFPNLLDCQEVSSVADSTAVIDAAFQRVATPQPPETPTEDAGDWPFWEELPPASAAGPGPWLPWSPPRSGTGLSVECCLRHLAAQIAMTATGPVLLDAVEGARIDLLTGHSTPLPALQGATNIWAPVAAAPGGQCWLSSRPPLSRPVTWHVDDGDSSPGAPGGHGKPIGIEPHGRLAWSGGRCHFDWRVLTRHGPAWWTPSNHGWPDGHAKKLYGYEDNDPLWVHLAPDASACLSVYKHDALITPGLPLRWRQLDGYAMAERARGEPRVLLFQREEGDDAYPADPFAAEDDARDRFPVVTLGPSAQARYAVGLDAPVWRVRGEQGEKLGSARDAWLLFDSRHQLVAENPGRLLAGWHRWVTCLRQERLERWDLLNGQVRSLGRKERPIAGAVGLAGSPNVLLLSLNGAEASIRIV